jgi:hypothetical protein
MSFTTSQFGSIGFFDCPVVVGTNVILGENTRGQIITSSLGYSPNQFPQYVPKPCPPRREPQTLRELKATYIYY